MLYTATKYEDNSRKKYKGIYKYTASTTAACHLQREENRWQVLQYFEAVWHPLSPALAPCAGALYSTVLHCNAELAGSGFGKIQLQSAGAGGPSVLRLRRLRHNTVLAAGALPNRLLEAELPPTKFCCLLLVNICKQLILPNQCLIQDLLHRN